MYQGVFTQCRGVAHNSRFSDFPQSAESVLFSFQYLCLWGIISIPILMQYGANTIPYICCLVRGIYHPIHFQWGIHSSHSWLLSLHITSPITMGCINSHGAPFHPVSAWGTFSSHLIISLNSWGTYPSHSHLCSSNISHFWHTWSSRLLF